MSAMMNDVFIVIPAFNESRIVGNVISKVRQVCPNVVLVDDGSSDGTAEIARHAGATIVRHAINLGQGAALQTGITQALRLGARAIVTFDADDQHDPADIALLLAALDNGAGAALGSRFTGRAIGLPAKRRLVLQAARWANYALTGLMLSDAHNGIRALTADTAAQLQLRQAGMAHATEIIAQLAKARVLITEVPVTIHYSAYSLAKGQKLVNAVRIMLDLMLRKLMR